MFATVGSMRRPTQPSSTCAHESARGGLAMGAPARPCGRIQERGAAMVRLNHRGADRPRLALGYGLGDHCFHTRPSHPLTASPGRPHPHRRAPGCFSTERCHSGKSVCPDGRCDNLTDLPCLFTADAPQPHGRPDHSTLCPTQAQSQPDSFWLVKLLQYILETPMSPDRIWSIAPRSAPACQQRCCDRPYNQCEWRDSSLASLQPLHTRCAVA